MDLIRVQDPFRVLGATGSCSFERALQAVDSTFAKPAQPGAPRPSLRAPPSVPCNHVHASGWQGARARTWSSCRTSGAPCRIESNQGGHPPAREPPHRLPTSHTPDGSHLAQEGVGSDKNGALRHPPPFPAAAEGGESGPQPLAGKHEPLRPLIPAPTTPTHPPR